ncbi:MAG: TonB-dependent receptor [Bacteroidia bacterium]|nr:TonB-dependent receptor [Bacteroidia bacterium]
MIFKSILFPIAILLIFTFALTAQEHKGQGKDQDAGRGNPNTQNAGFGTVYGTVTDAEGTHPVEYANIVLYRAKDSTMINGTITDRKGKFTLKNIAAGKFYIVVKFIGFKTQILPSFLITPKESTVNTGSIKLDVDTKSIGEVTVTSEKKLIEYNFDKKVVNVEKNITTAGGTAVDVMQNIPSVTVDADGVVSLRGSTNVTVLIDGRPSSLTGAKLEQIPASSIENIEIITNPSAKFSPDGMSGIINIKLKKKISKGLNGLATLGYGTWEKYSGSVNLNYSMEKLNIFGSYDARSDLRGGYGKSDASQTFNYQTTYINQYADNSRTRLSNNFKIGADYAFNPTITMTLTGLFNMDQSKRTEDLYYSEFNTQHVLDKYYTQKGVEAEDDKSYEVSFNYKKNYAKKDQAFTADIMFTNSLSNESNDMTPQPYTLNLLPDYSSPLTRQNETTLNNYKMGNVQLNYNHPIDSLSKFEAGYQGIIRNMDDDYHYDSLLYSTNDWLSTFNTKDHFIYTEQVHAIYGTYGNTIKKFQIQVGLRLEQALRKSEQRTQNITYSDGYFSPFPTVHISRKVGKINEFMLSYSRRINRPDPHSLDPFVDRTRPGMISYGNPKLKPEYVNSYEIGHALELKKTSVYSTIFYRQIDDVIKRYTFLDTITGIKNMTQLNMAKGISYGVEFILDREIFKWWRVNANFSYFYTKIDGTNVDNSLTNDNISWTAKLSTNATLKKGFNIQLTGNYRAPMVTPQGAMTATYNVDIALKKDLFNEQAAVSLRVSDIFNTQKFETSNSGAGFSAHFIRKRESRVAFLTFTYKINGGIKQRQKKIQRDSEINIDDGGGF